MSDEKQEIIIVKRGGGDHDDHHGGAWKIAFADFMTAMMALFLVLWLVNAANEETKKAVASYFNPVKLVDRNKSSRGISDPGNVSLPQDEESNDQTGSADDLTEFVGAKNEGVEVQKFSDSQFFADPMTVLDLIAEQAAANAAVAEVLADMEPDEMLTASDAGFEFIDPFAPDNWRPLENNDPSVFDDPGDQQIAVESAMEAEPAVGDPAAPQAIDTIETTALPDQVDVLELRSDSPSETAVDPMAVAIEEGDAASEPKAMESALETAESTEITTPTDGLDTAEMTDAAEKQELIQDKGLAQEQEVVEAPDAGAEELISELSQALIDAGVPEAALTFETRADRVAISLADATNFEMFGIGSAVPTPEAVRAIQALATAIGQADMLVSIEGHTDARGFQSGGSDNWKLSSDRAHAAFYMLRREGIPEAKFTTLQGRADRELAVPELPFDARNRRIEIFLEPAT